MELRNDCQCTFKSRVGKRLAKLVTKEYGNNEVQVAKFKNLFSKAHNDLDTNTVVDIDKKERYVFSNTLFPNISYCYEKKVVQGPLSEIVVTECPKTFKTGQMLLFQNIVRVLSEKNKVSLEKIEKMGTERITHPSASKIFTETIQTAKWIQENMPQKKLNKINFEIADNIIIQEKLTKNNEILENYKSDLFSYLAKIQEILE